MCSLLMLYLHWYIIAALTDNNNFFLSKNRSVEGKYWELNRVHFVEVIQKFYSAIDLVRKLCEKVISEKYSQKPLFMVLFTLKHFTTYVNGPFTHMCEHKSQFRSAVWEASGKRSQSPHDLGETNKNSHMVVIKNPTCSFCWPLNKFNEWLGNHFMNNSHICNTFSRATTTHKKLKLKKRSVHPQLFMKSQHWNNINYGQRHGTRVPAQMEQPQVECDQI